MEFTMFRFLKRNRKELLKERQTIIILKIIIKISTGASPSFFSFILFGNLS